MCRRFLGLALLVGLLGCTSVSNTAPTGDTLRHDDLHLSVTKPPTWRYLTPREKRDARHANAYANKRYDSWVKLEAFPPRVSIAKYPEPHRGLNPRVSIDRYPLDDLRFKTSEWLAARMLRSYQYLFDRVSVETPVVRASIDGKPAATLRVRYALEVKEGPVQLIDEQIWVVATGISAYLVSARCAQNGPDAAFDEISAIVSSLHFD